MSRPTHSNILTAYGRPQPTGTRPTGASPTGTGSLRALIAYGHQLPTGFNSLRARPQPTIRRVAPGLSTGGPRVLLSVTGGASAPNSRQDPGRRRARGSRPTAQARRRGLGVSPGVVGRRGNRGAYVPRVRCVVPIGRLISPYYSISVPCARRPVKGTYERIPWYPLYVPRGGDHPRMYPARTTTDGAYHHSMKRRQHETGEAACSQTHTTSRSLRASCDARALF